MKRLKGWSGLLLGAVLAAGCSSHDRHVFVAPPTQSAKVSVVEVGSEEVLWSKTAPPGYKLQVNLDRKGDLPTTKLRPAERLSWRLYPGSTTSLAGYPLGNVEKEGRVDLPGTPVRLVLDYAGEQAGVSKLGPALQETESESEAVETTQPVTAEPAPPAPAEEPAAAPEASESSEAAEPATPAETPAESTESTESTEATSSEPAASESAPAEQPADEAMFK